MNGPSQDPTPAAGVPSGMSSPASTRPGAESPASRIAAQDAALLPDRHFLRRLRQLWLGVAVVEALLYLLLYRSPELKGLYELPAVATIVAGAIMSWQSRRRRTGRDRRHADRRHVHTDD